MRSSGIFIHRNHLVKGLSPPLQKQSSLTARPSFQMEKRTYPSDGSPERVIGPAHIINSPGASPDGKALISVLYGPQNCFLDLHARWKQLMPYTAGPQTPWGTNRNPGPARPKPGATGGDPPGNVYVHSTAPSKGLLADANLATSCTRC